jgi:hypothetical protein
VIIGIFNSAGQNYDHLVPGFFYSIVYREKEKGEDEREKNVATRKLSN